MASPYGIRAPEDADANRLVSLACARVGGTPIGPNGGKSVGLRRQSMNPFTVHGVVAEKGC